MNCIICKKSLDDYTPLCADHAPAWGESVSAEKTTVTVGELRLLDVLVLKLMGHKIIRWWVGTDVWLLFAFPRGRGKLSVIKHRLIYHLTKFFVSENWLTSERLKDEFISCGGQKSVVRYYISGVITEKVEKVAHSEVNIAYYLPKPGGESQKFTYGFDLIYKLAELFPEVTWCMLDGSFSKSDMKAIYSILDGCVRPNRHDGRPRILEECKINSIPFYHSADGRPDLDEMVKFVRSVIWRKQNSMISSCEIPSDETCFSKQDE